MVINKEKPIAWKGKYIILCTQVVYHSETEYAKYCNLEKVTKNGNVKVRVFGYRLRGDINKSRVIYIHASRLKLYSDYFNE